MDKKPLGNSNIYVAPPALGTNVFGWTIDEDASFEVLDGYTATGYNLLDTADVYSVWKPGNKGGESETIIGKWMKERKNRANMVIATKVGMKMTDNKKGLSKKYILQSAEDSLIRLQTDYIDLYQSHEDDPLTAIEETLEAYDLLLQQGKVRAIGASNFPLKRLAESIDISKSKDLPLYQTYQPQYNLYNRKVFEKDYQQFCLKNNISVICYSSLASGFLTGKYRSEKDLSKSAREQSIKKLMTERGMRILDALDIVSKNYHSSPASVSLAWLMKQPAVTAPIASATSTKQLEDLINASALKLDENALQILNEASAE